MGEGPDCGAVAPKGVGEGPDCPNGVWARVCDIPNGVAADPCVPNGLCEAARGADPELAPKGLAPPAGPKGVEEGAAVEGGIGEAAGSALLRLGVEGTVLVDELAWPKGELEAAVDGALARPESNGLDTLYLFASF